jgi:hypothetical protein
LSFPAYVHRPRFGNTGKREKADNDAQTKKRLNIKKIYK